jgi:hypothetical protein
VAFPVNLYSDDSISTKAVIIVINPEFDLAPSVQFPQWPVSRMVIRGLYEFLLITMLSKQFANSFYLLLSLFYYMDMEMYLDLTSLDRRSALYEINIPF